jgi:NodT family efflux transporter outer membrane factor (OMF) lipoprotein
MRVLLLLFLSLSVSLSAWAADTDEKAWWKGFGDPLLDELVERATAANPDVRIAVARLAEAQANGRISRSALAPQVDANAAATKLRGGVSQGVIKVPSTAAGSQGGSVIAPFDTSVVSGGFTMRWEADVFGGIRKTVAASNADARAANEYLNDVQVMVRAEVARSYIDMRDAEAQIAIVRSNIASEEDLLGLIRSRTAAGLASELDVQRQVAQVAAVRASLPPLDALRLQAVYRIGVLSGQRPEALEARLEGNSEALRTPAIPAALPGDLLKQRPDVRRAEQQIAAALARAGAARADLYPKFIITGLAGRQSTDFAGLTLGGGNYFSIGPAVTLPIFNYGRIRSHIAAQDAQLEQARQQYEQEVLAAFEETRNAFVAHDRSEVRGSDLNTELAAAKTSVELSRELYVRGLGDFLSVLDAQRQVFQAEREVAANRSDILRNTVALFKALGD